ncbi:MAG: hypothetical protein JWP58_1985 [Hymenobacter sp.]|nr:hypothetical protein [Hymenobacter sp.]
MRRPSAALRNVVIRLALPEGPRALQLAVGQNGGIGFQRLQGAQQRGRLIGQGHHLVHMVGHDAVSYQFIAPAVPVVPGLGHQRRDGRYPQPGGAGRGLVEPGIETAEIPLLRRIVSRVFRVRLRLKPRHHLQRQRARQPKREKQRAAPRQPVRQVPLIILRCIHARM